MHRSCSIFGTKSLVLDNYYNIISEQVLSALPAIDVTPPIFRQHVACKMKKLQKEAERCAQIVEDNFTLLQHLRTIMNTSRIDNMWVQPPPNFLNRVGIYPPKSGKLPSQERSADTKLDEPKTRKDKCLGCNPNQFVKKEVIPELRVPWEPPKPRLSKRSSSSEIGVLQFVSRSDRNLHQFKGKIRPQPSPVDTSPKKKSQKRRKKHVSYPQLSETQSLVLSKGGMSICVSFPQSTEILLQGSNQEKIIQREFCECKSFPKIRSRFRNEAGVLSS